MALSWDVGGDLLAVGKANSSYFADGGVRLLGSFGCHLDANPSFEWGVVEDGSVLNGVETARQSNGLRLPLWLAATLLY